MHRTKNTCLLGIGLAVLLFAQVAHSQGPTHHWSTRFAGSGGNTDAWVAVDWAGNAILTGPFVGTMDFGGGVLTSAGASDIYVAKIGPGGDHLWSKCFGDADPQYGEMVAVDASGNVFITGHFHGTVDFGGGPLGSAGWTDIFVAKFDPHGGYLWSRSFGDTEYDNYPKITIDHSGNVLLTGWFKGTIDFGGGVLTSAGGYDTFAAKLDPDGGHMWSERFGDAEDQHCTGIAVDTSGNVILAAYDLGATDLGGGPLAYNNFVVKLDSDGGHLWSQSYESALLDGVAVDDSSNVILTGYAYGTDFGGGPLPSVVGTIFLAKFDPAGAHVWSQAFPLANTEYYTAIVAVDLSGNVYLTGTFKEGIDLGGDIFWTWYDYEYDMYLAKYDPTGAHVWSERFCDSDVGRGSDQNGESIALDPFGYIFVVGQPGSTPDFGGGGLATGASPFVVKFGPTGTAVTEESIRYQSGIDAYPNPFNPSTTITYSTSQSGAVHLAVYDARGRLVSTLVDDFQIAGDYKATWDGRDATDASVASGVYFVRLESIGQVQTHKITLVE